MKQIAFIDLLLCFSVVQALTYMEVRPTLFRPFVSECLCSYQEEPSNAEDWIEKIEFVNRACFKCFIRCVAIKVGYVSDDGIINIPIVFKKIPNITMDIINNCTNITQNELDLCERAYQYSKCIVNAFD